MAAWGKTVKNKMIYLASSSSSSYLLWYLHGVYNVPGVFLSTSNIINPLNFHYDEKDQIWFLFVEMWTLRYQDSVNCPGSHSQ